MTTLEGKNKSIKIAINNITTDANLEDNHSISYIVNGPAIICDDKADADYIQKEINSFAMNLCNKIINNKKGDTNE